MGQTRTIIRLVGVVLALLSPFFFPLGVSVFLALVGAVATPVVPLAVGLLLDALYWTSGASMFPVASIVGALVSLAAFFVHRYVRTSIMYA